MHQAPTPPTRVRAQGPSNCRALPPPKKKTLLAGQSKGSRTDAFLARFAFQTLISACAGSKSNDCSSLSSLCNGNSCGIKLLTKTFKAKKTEKAKLACCTSSAVSLGERAGSCIPLVLHLMLVANLRDARMFVL